MPDCLERFVFESGTAATGGGRYSHGTRAGKMPAVQVAALHGSASCQDAS